MKKAFLIAIVMLTLVCSLSYAGKYKKYADKSGSMTYTMSGTTTGEITYYWDDWGYKELIVENSVTKVMGFSTENKSFKLSIGKYTYEWKEGDSEIKKMENPVLAMLEDEKSDQKDVENYGKNILEKMGFKKTGTETVAGKTCEVWESESMGKTWVWKTYSMKSETSIMGMTINQTMKELKNGAAVDPKKLELPKDKKIVEQTMPTGEEGDNPEDVKKAQEMLKGLFK